MAAQPAQPQQYRKSQRVNLGEYEKEEDVLDAIEQSRRVSKMMVAAVQKGSKFEVSQILEHYGLPMTSRLHFKVANVVMEQWFSLMGINDEDALWEVLSKNQYAMNMLRDNADKGRMRLSDIFSDWELGIGALQSKTIRRFLDYHKENKGAAKAPTDSAQSPTDTDNEDKKDAVEEAVKASDADAPVVESEAAVANGGDANSNNKEEPAADTNTDADAEKAKEAEQKADK